LVVGESMARPRKREGKISFGITRAHIHFDFRCMMFNVFEMSSMFMCYSYLLIGTMESWNKIDCSRKHGATKKEVMENFIWSYTRTHTL
jgi:hypothetical protein